MKDPAIHKYVISVGSNVGNGREMVARGLDFLGALLGSVNTSEIYTTESVSLGDNSMYFNAVVSGFSILSIDEITVALKAWERRIGRIPGSKKVVGDMDLVVVDDVVVRRRDFDRTYFQIGFNQIAGKEDSTDVVED